MTSSARNPFSHSFALTGAKRAADRQAYLCKGMSVLTIVESHADLRGLYGSQIFHSHFQNLRLLQFTRSLKKTSIRIEKNECLLFFLDNEHTYDDDEMMLMTILAVVMRHTDGRGSG